MEKNRFRFGNSIFFIYLIYVVWVVLVEWINFIISLINSSLYYFGVAEIIGVIICGCTIFFLRKRICFDKLNFKPEIVIAGLIILIYGFIFSVLPDRGFDTLNYHLIAQNPRFKNYFIEDYGYGNFQVWGFRLCDRMFFYFRLLLGYRLGTLLNAVSLFVSFIQVYSLLEVLSSHNLSINKSVVFRISFNRVLWALIIVFPLDTIMMFGSYYVDALAIPIGIEVVRILLYEPRKKKNIIDILYFAMLCGIWIGMKLTNVVFVIPCVMVFIFFHYRSFKIYTWIESIGLGIFPYLQYLIFNTICTGNPVFPYYNTLFKSVYYPLINFKDSRWGGTNLFEKVFWVIFAALKPEYRQSEIYDSYNGTLIVGLISFVGFIILLAFRKKINIQYKIIIFLGIVSSLLWSFTTGISRYFIMGRIVWGLVAFSFVSVVTEQKKIIGIIISSSLSLILSFCTVMNFRTVFWGNSWTANKWSYVAFEDNISKIFRDNDIITPAPIKADAFILSDYVYQGVAELIDDRVYTLFSLYQGTPLVNGIEKTIKNNKEVYDLHSPVLSDIKSYIDKLNDMGVYIQNFEYVHTSLGDYLAVKLYPITNDINMVWCSDEESLIIKNNMSPTIGFTAGRFYDWLDRNVIIRINGIKDDEIFFLEDVPISNSEVSSYTVNVDKLSDGIDYFVLIPMYEGTDEVFPKDQIDKVFILNYTN